MTPKATQKPSTRATPTPHGASCVQCGEPFKATVYWQRFCSLKCRYAFQYQITKKGRALVKEQMEKEATKS